MSVNTGNIDETVSISVARKLYTILDYINMNKLNETQLQQLDTMTDQILGYEPNEPAENNSEENQLRQTLQRYVCLGWYLDDYLSQLQNLVDDRI